MSSQQPFAQPQTDFVVNKLCSPDEGVLSNHVPSPYAKHLRNTDPKYTGLPVFPEQIIFQGENTKTIVRNPVRKTYHNNKFLSIRSCYAVPNSEHIKFIEKARYAETTNGTYPFSFAVCGDLQTCLAYLLTCSLHLPCSCRFAHQSGAFLRG